MKNHDTISPQEFGQQLPPNSTAPSNDSPDDSEEDTAAELSMGVNFTPEPKNRPAEEHAQALRRENRNRTIDDLPETAKAISSERPEPSADSGQASDTH